MIQTKNANPQKKAGREGRDKYGSKKGTDERSSITNKEKAKKTKAYMMVVHKRSVQGKVKRSLREKQVSSLSFGKRRVVR